MTSISKAQETPSSVTVPITIVSRPVADRIFRYAFWGTVGAATAGLSDIVIARFRSGTSLMPAEWGTIALFSAGAFALLGVFGGAAVGLMAQRWSLRSLLWRLRRPRNVMRLLLAVGMLFAGLEAAAYRFGILIDAVDFRPALLLLIAVVSSTAGIQLTGRVSRHPSRTLFGAAVLIAIALFVSLPRIGATAGIPRFLAGDTALVKPLFRGAQGVFDSDGDGFPRALCHADCDCDDRDSSRNPAAIEIPGNGIDEDCSGRDLILADRSSRVPVAAAETSYPTAFSPPLNIVLITVDALRADRLHAYGHNRETSPNLDEFAAENVRFAEVRSQGPSTRHSFPVFLSGRYFPAIHQEKGKKWWRLLPDNVTFGEILKSRGYRTVAVLPYFRFKENSGFQQGFDVWEPVLDADRDSTWAPTGDLVTNRGIEHLKELSAQKGPWLLWLHYFDPHASYVHHGDQPSFGNERADLYDGEIYYVDRQIGRFFDALKKSGYWDTAAVVVTSDHGEGIGLPTDHGFNYHGFSLYDSETRVPFMIRAPGMTHRTVDQSVALIDLTPTLLELGGAQIPESFHGTSLLPWAFGSAIPHPPFLMHLPEASPWEAAVDWPYKLIWEKKPNRFQLFNLVKDPHEQQDISQAEPETVQRLKDFIQRENYRIEVSEKDGAQ